MTTLSLQQMLEPHLLEQMFDLAQKQGRSPEALINEALTIYLNVQEIQTAKPSEQDPLIGLFAGSPNLATDAEEILYSAGVNHV